MALHLKSGTLYLFKQEGCGACEEAEKVLDKFRADTEKVRHKLLILELDVSKANYHVHGYVVKSTPTYLLSVNNQPFAEYTKGPMTLKQLEKFCDPVLGKG